MKVLSVIGSLGLFSEGALKEASNLKPDRFRRRSRGDSIAWCASIDYARTTSRPEGVEAATPKLVGRKTRDIVREAIRPLDYSSAYEEMATAARQIGSLMHS